MRKERTRRLRLWVPVLLLLLMATGVGFRPVFAQTAAPVRGGTLRVGWVPQARTFDPHLSVQWAERFVLYMVFNTLVGLDKNFNVVPELARSWDISEDGRKITFYLQKEVKFHDGTDFTAEVVKWNIERILDPATKSPQRSQLEPYVERVVATNPLTAAFRLKKPYAPLLAALAERPGFMLSPAAVGKYGAEFGRHPVGTGPFRFVEWVPDDHLTVERFPGYWEPGKPYVDRVAARVVPEPAVRLTMVRTGEVDIATEVPSREIPSLRNDPNLKVEVSPPARWHDLQWQVDKPPFNNKALRQAIALAIDRKELLDLIFDGVGQVASGPVVPGLWWSNPAFTGIQFNLEAAKRKLTEAGYPNGFQYKFTVQNTPEYIRLGELIQAQLKKINVTMDFDLDTPADAYAHIVDRKTNWTITNWTQRADPNGLLYILLHSKGFGNSTGYMNARVDQLLEQAATIFDPEKRKPLYQEAERLIVDDVPYVFLVFAPDVAVMSRRIQNWGWIPDLVPRYRDLWLSK
jgi:peptide/nickel transport system substrate-binding protein